MWQSSIQHTIVALLIGFTLAGCSSANSFHLRKPVQLAGQYKSIKVQGLPRDGAFFKVLKRRFNESGVQLLQQPDKAFATTSMRIKNLREGKRVVAYDSKRRAREYLLFLKFDYSVSSSNHGTHGKTHRINLDRSFLYDADFILGKREEERQIRQSLYQEAARLILLNLRYSKSH